MANEELEQPLPLSHLAHELKTTPRSIYAQVNKLRRAGWIPSAEEMAQKERKPRPTPHDNVTAHRRFAEIKIPADELEATPIMSEREALQRMSHTARQGPLQLRQAAQKEIIATARQTGSRIGPPVPLTEEEQAKELAVLIKMVGDKVLRMAVKIAYPKPEDATPEPTKPAQETVSDDSSDGGVHTAVGEAEIPHDEASVDPIVGDNEGESGQIRDVGAV
jgi:hypothetical protein